MSEKNDAMADKMDRVAQNWFNFHEDNWGPDSGSFNQSMVDCGNDDAKDLRAIGELIRTGHKTKAGAAADSLDTAVRDEIPESVWEFIH